MVVVAVNLLLDKIEQIVSNLDAAENRSKADEVLLLAFQAGRDKLLKHYNKTNWIYCVALILDPRHKMESFNVTTWGKDLKDKAYEKFCNIIKTEYDNDCLSNLEGSDLNEEDNDEYAIDFGAVYLKKKKLMIGNLRFKVS